MKTWLAIVFGSAVSVIGLWLTSIPLGIPGEWTWERLPTEPDLFWNLVGGAITAGLFIAFVIQGWQRLEGDSALPQNGVGPLATADRLELHVQREAVRPRFEVKPGDVTGRRSRVEVAAWLMGLVAASFAWLWIVQELAPVKSRLGKSAFVLYYPSSSGYFTRARDIDPSVAALLARYEDLMRQGDVLHTGTHPPGLFLVFHGLIALCGSSPGLGEFLDSTQSPSFHEACDVIAANNLRRPIPRPLTSLDRRVLWLATLLVMGAAALAVVPLYGLIRRSSSAQTAWVCASLWPAVPTVAIFIPKSDVAFAMIGLSILWLWLTAWDGVAQKGGQTAGHSGTTRTASTAEGGQTPFLGNAAWDRRSLVLSILAGIVAWCGLLCSLAFLPLLLAAALLTIGSTLFDGIIPVVEFTATTKSPPPPTNGPSKLGWRHGLCMISAIVGFTGMTAVIWHLARINLLNVWWLNYQNHAGFYRQFSRTYWKWLLVNPIELSFAAGWPVTCLAVATCGGVVSRLRRSEGESWCNLVKVVAPLVFVWSLLWLTGKNSGEAARIWILLFPWLIWIASFHFEAMSKTVTRFSIHRWQVIALLAIQFAVCLLTVARVSGFHSDAG